MSDYLFHPLLADLKGVVHGFGTAHSRPDPVAGDGESVKAQSLDRAGRAALSLAGEGAGPLLTLRQIHTKQVLIVRRHDAYIPPAESIRADAIISERPGLLVAVKTADCLPVLVADPARGVVAAVHAGWRGSEVGILARVVKRLDAQFGSKPEDLRVVFGPSARACCYEIGPDVAERFSSRYEAAVRLGGDGRLRLDLVAVNRAQALREGVLPAHIGELNACTICSTAPSFYSYRRERENAGRLVNFIGLAPQPESRPALRIGGLRAGAELLLYAPGSEED